jgi:AraC-like DNA-binding protein
MFKNLKSDGTAQLILSLQIPSLLTTTGHRLANTNVKWHAHDYTELILVTQGKCIIQSEEKTLIGTPGDLFVIPPHLSHFQPEKELIGTSYLGFYHNEKDFDSSFRVISVKNDMYITRWLQDIIDLHNVILDIIPYTQIVIGLLNSVIVKLKQIEEHLETAQSIPPKLKKAIETIQNNIVNTISVEQIAASADISASYLTKLFAKYLNCSPIQYQQKLRMQLACKYLLNPYMTTKQTAKKCGYDNINLFIRIFRKHYKTSPGKWREQFSEKFHKKLSLE